MVEGEGVMTMLDERQEAVFRGYDDGLIEFARELVRVRSYSGEEEGVARLVEAKMKELGYDEVFIDGTGNVAVSYTHLVCCVGKPMIFQGRGRYF